MSAPSTARAVEVRHLQLARAVIAAIAAVMITFSPDHSAPVGLSIFSGFAILTGLVFLLGARSVYPKGARWVAVTLGIVAAVAGMVASVAAYRSTTLFFVVVIAWAALSAVVEVAAGFRSLRVAKPAAQRPGGPAERSEARDAVVIGSLSFALAIALALVPSGFALQYYIEDAGRSFTLTGTTIGVGLFGGYAAILAVYLAIAAFSPRAMPAVEPAPAADDRGAV